MLHHLGMAEHRGTAYLMGKGIAPVWGDMLRNYYELMGWDTETGKPLPKTLEDLGLGHIISDIW